MPSVANPWAPILCEPVTRFIIICITVHKYYYPLYATKSSLQQLLNLSLHANIMQVFEDVYILNCIFSYLTMINTHDARID